MLVFSLDVSIYSNKFTGDELARENHTTVTLSRHKLSREPRENCSHANKNGLQVLHIVGLIYYVNIIRTHVVLSLLDLMYI